MDFNTHANCYICNFAQTAVRMLIKVIWKSSKNHPETVANANVLEMFHECMRERRDTVGRVVVFVAKYTYAKWAFRRKAVICLFILIMESTLLHTTHGSNNKHDSDCNAKSDTSLEKHQVGWRPCTVQHTHSYTRNLVRGQIHAHSCTLAGRQT